MVSALLQVGCGGGSDDSQPETTDKGEKAIAKKMPPKPTSDKPPSSEPEKKEGMVFIPEGSFIAGTPPGTVPRCPDEEMEGVKVNLTGFYIDEYPMPGPGKPPTVNVSWGQAKKECEAAGKRLCTELEWERVCKGTDNSRFPYGDIWDVGNCGAKKKTGSQPPLGSLPMCVTEEGVHDMTGYVWEWTASKWGIPGSAQNDKVLRGGNKRLGKLANRCANRFHKPAETSTENIGYRCCAGDANKSKVNVELAQGPKFEKADMPVEDWKTLKTDEGNLDIIDDYRGVRRVEQLKDPAELFNREKSDYPLSRLAGDSLIWRPVQNSSIYVMNALYKMHRSRGEGSLGTLLIFAEKDPSGVMRFLALFDRPDEGGEQPLFYANPRKNGDLEVILVWKTSSGPTALATKVKYNCGRIRLKPVKWLTVNNAQLPVPPKVPNLKPVYTPGEGV